MKIRRLSPMAILAGLLAAGLLLWAGPAPAAVTAAPAATATPATVAKATPTEAAPPEMAKVAEEVAKDVEAIRGWKFKKSVPNRVCSEQEARTYMEKEFERDVPPEKLATSQAMLKTLGLLPADADLKKLYLDLMTLQVAAFYDPEAKVLCLIRPEKGKAPSAMDRIILAHELCHALDDQYLDLEKFVKDHEGKTEDGDLATSSVVEGSATVMMTQYMTRMMAAGKLDLTEVLQYSKDEEAKDKAFLEAPAYFHPIMGAYVCGMNFLARGKFMSIALGGRDVGKEMEAAVKDAPRSTAQILHPEKYWDKDTRDEPVLVSDEDMLKTLNVLTQSTGWWVIHKDTIGEMLCAVLTRPKGAAPDATEMGQPGYWTNEAATGWGGDRFYLLAPGKGPGAGAILEASKGNCFGVWITLWNSEKDRDEFVKAYESAQPNPKRVTHKWGNLGAVFFFDFGDAFRKLIEDALDKSPPHMTKDGKAWTPWAP